MATIAGHIDTSTQRERDRCLRLYGGLAITANVLLGTKGFLAHDPFMTIAGFGTAAMQGINAVKGDRYTDRTIPCIIALAGVFTAGGIHAHNMKRAAFGLVKATGISVIKWPDWLPSAINKASPLARLLAKLPPFDAKKSGELILGASAVSLCWDGIEQILEGLRQGGDGKVLMLGLTTCAATAALALGQHYFAKAPDKTLCENARPMPMVPRAPLRFD